MDELPRADVESDIPGALDYMKANDVSGLLVIKNGQIVFERYGLGRGPNDRWTSFSVAKSITSTLVGEAIADGKIKSLDAPVDQHYITELKGSAYDGVTVRQLLTMSSGVKWNEDYTDPKSDVNVFATTAPSKPGANGIAEYMAKLPREAKPGTKFVYKTGESDLDRHPGQPGHGKDAGRLSVGENLEADGRRAGRGMDDRPVGRGDRRLLHLHDLARLWPLRADDAERRQGAGQAGGAGEMGEGRDRQSISTPAGRTPAMAINGGSSPDGSYEAVGIFGQTIYVNPEGASGGGDQQRLAGSRCRTLLCGARRVPASGGGIAARREGDANRHAPRRHRARPAHRPCAEGDGRGGLGFRACRLCRSRAGRRCPF